MCAFTRRAIVRSGVFAALTAAVTPTVSAGEPPADDELTAEELAEIEAALAADAAPGDVDKPAGAITAVSKTLLNPEISVITDVALAFFSDEDAAMQTGAHDPTSNGFTLQQVEMALTRSVDPYFKVDGALVFTAGGVEVEEFFATTLGLPANLQARAGQFLTRVGRINPTHPHTWEMVDQPLAIGRIFGAEGNRAPGMELSYLTPLPWYVEVIGSVTNPAGGETARSFYGDDNLGIDTPLDFQSLLAIRQFFELSDNWSLLWGSTAITGPNATGRDNRTNVFATDLYIKYRPITRGSYTIVSLTAEFFHRRRQIAGDRLTDHNGYASLFWKFSRHLGVAARYEYGSAAENRAGDTGMDDLDPEWVDGRHRASANITLWPTEFSRIRLQGSVDRPGWVDDPIVAGMLSFEFNIGAHAAHTF